MATSFQRELSETFPGISPHADLKDGVEVKYHKYYQWVCFVLFLQAALFYIPRYLWKSSEGGKIRMLVQELQVNVLTQSKVIWIGNGMAIEIVVPTYLHT
jgi:hypothetical protein